MYIRSENEFIRYVIHTTKISKFYRKENECTKSPTLNYVLKYKITVYYVQLFPWKIESIFIENLDKIATVTNVNFYKKKFYSKIIQHLLVTLGQQLIITTLIASFEHFNVFECEMDRDCPVC